MSSFVLIELLACFLFPFQIMILMLLLKIYIKPDFSSRKTAKLTTRQRLTTKYIVSPLYCFEKAHQMDCVVFRRIDVSQSFIVGSLSGRVYFQKIIIAPGITRITMNHTIDKQSDFSISFSERVVLSRRYDITYRRDC